MMSKLSSFVAALLCMPVYLIFSKYLLNLCINKSNHHTSLLNRWCISNNFCLTLARRCWCYPVGMYSMQNIWRSNWKIGKRKSADQLSAQPNCINWLDFGDNLDIEITQWDFHFFGNFPQCCIQVPERMSDVQNPVLTCCIVRKSNPDVKQWTKKTNKPKLHPTTQLCVVSSSISNLCYVFGTI